MRELTIIEYLLRITPVIIIISFFALSLNPVYADNDRLSDYTTSYNHSEHTDNSEGNVGISVLNEFLSNSTIAKSDNLRYAQSEIDKTKDAIGSDTYGAGASASDWYFSIAPYAWLLALDGTIGVKGQTADVNMSFGDLLDQAEFAGQLH